MIRQLLACAVISIVTMNSAGAESSRSPSRHQTGTTRGIASDADPVGQAVGQEPAMVDPHSTGSIELDKRAKVECSVRTSDGKTITTHHVGNAHDATCK